MGNSNVTSIYFSPSGSTSAVAKKVASSISETVTNIDLIKEKNLKDIFLQSNDIAIVTVPVFYGRIPNVCVNMLKKVRGTDSCAIAIVVYGNRAYEDALLELVNMLLSNGFKLIGAGAAIAQHSIFQTIATGRPDDSDKQKLEYFAKRCIDNKNTESNHLISVPGNIPYRKLKKGGLIPTVNKNCIGCKKCIKICPVGAISDNNPRETNKEMCISCTACIHICPKGARNFKGPKVILGEKIIQAKCKRRLEPEFFF